MNTSHSSQSSALPLSGALACLALTMLLSSLGISIANVGLPMGAVFMHAAGTSNIASASTAAVVTGAHAVFLLAALLSAIALAVVIAPMTRTGVHSLKRLRPMAPPRS